MTYDFAQVVRIGAEQMMVMFTSQSEYKQGKKNIKVLTGYDESGNIYTAVGRTTDNYKTEATNVARVT